MLTAFALLLTPDISCNLSGMYTGNAINPTFTLKIGGPRKREWVYTHSDDMFGRNTVTTEHRGTYEFDGDLVIFTGTQTDDPKGEVKFGLNYGFPNGKVAFDRLLPDGKGRFGYARKWFRKSGKEWHPAEEWRLIAAIPDGSPKSFEADWKGQRIRWDAAGKRTVEEIAAPFRYTRGDNVWYSLKQPVERKWEWLPDTLIFEQSDSGKTVAVAWANRYIGDLNGFHPRRGSPPAP